MNNKIKKWIKKNESWELSGYIIPTKLYSPRSVGIKEIDLKNFRDNSIKNISKHEQTLIDMLGDTEESYIREFPVPIFDKELWYKICRSFRADEDEITGKSILWLDFFLLSREGCVIETDGVQHSADLVQYKTDLIRDQYLKEKYGIETYRFDKFLEDWENGLEWIFLSIPQVPRFEFVGWEDDMFNNWCEENNTYIHLIELLDNLYPNNNYIKISTKQVYKQNLGTLLRLDLKRFNSLLFDITGKRIEIIPSKP